MKNFRTNLIVLLTLGLGGCSLGASMSQQVTSFNVDCKPDDIQITDEEVALNSEESWTAKCGGKTYRCTYFPESDSDCYEIDE